MTMGVGHYENFPVASLLLPARFRHPIAVIYRFARTADDFADEGTDDAATRLRNLQDFRDRLDAIERGEMPADALFAQIAAIRAEYRLPLQLFRDLLDAFAQDVVKTRYADFAELLDYCRRSANPVGRLLLHVFDAASAENMQHSDSICTSLQLINFWQDVAIDFANGRVYLPQDDLTRCGVAESRLAAADTGGGFRDLMRFEVQRARTMMLEGAPLGGWLPGRIGLEIRTIVQGGLRILEKIEAVNFDVFRRRPVLGAWDWPLLLARAL
jgi:squalene synthase HpnC